MELNGSKPYAFDAPHFIVNLVVKPAKPDDPASKPKIASHKLRKPTLEELSDWEKSQAYETVEVSKRENQIVSDSDAATARLWEKIILEVEGYDFKDGNLDWRPLSDEQKTAMKFGHKLAAINGIYRFSTSIESDDSEGFSFDGAEWRIRQEIGSPEDPAVVIHTMREPTEMEIRKFTKNSSSLTSVKGSKKQHLKFTTNLKTYVEMYDALIETVETGGARVAPLLVDPMFKRQAVSTLMEGLTAQLQD